ncbi:MAG: glycine zipper 2TM domain-containing protein [Aestuariibacter sp.]
MKKLIYSIAIMSMAFAGPLMAGTNYAYDYARVIKAEPVYETIYHDVPVRQCHYSTPRRYHKHPHSHREHSYHSATPTVMGAIIGGAIGNAIGHNKSNKKVGMAAGAILGGAIGHDIAQQKRHHYYDGHHTKHYRHTRHYGKTRHCSVSYESSESYRRLKGYHVTYQYKGERYDTFTHEHPGHKIKIKINISPAVQGY